MASPVVVSRIQNRRGLQSQFNAGPGTLYPNGYNGVGGYGSLPGFDSTNYPNVLLPGELALCTDTRRTFLGNINGEFIELSAPVTGDIVLSPTVVVLPPVGTFTVIPELTYTATPFMTFLYDLTDSLSADWNVIGTTFSRNGQLQVTATAYFVGVPNPPFPTPTPVTLSDTGTEINTVLPNSITFRAQYDISHTNIEIMYMHDFAGSLTFSTSTIKWLPF
jgi:hypothetical protein